MPDKSQELGSAQIPIRATLDKLDKDLEGARKKISASLGGVADKLKNVIAGVAIGAAVKKVADGIGQMVQESAKVQAVERTFAKLAQTVGSDATNALNTLREATRGMVTDADLMQAGNKFLAMGLADSAEEAGELAEMATQLGMAMGSDATSSMENFALMLANQSVPRLDSFGISSAQARDRINELMATVPGMTRETAFMTAVMEQGAIAMEKVGEQSGGAVGAAARLSVAMGNLKNNVGRGFLDVFANVQGSLASIVTKLTPMLTRVAQGLGAIANQAFQTLKMLVTRVAERMGIDFDQLADNSLSWGENITIQLARGIAGAISYVLTALNKLGTAIANMLRPGSPPKILPDLDRWGAGAAQAYMDGWGEADLGVFGTLSGKIGDYLANIPNLAQEKLVPLKAAINAELAEAINSVDSLGSASRTLFDDVIAGARKLPDSFAEYARSLVDVEIAQAGVESAMQALERATEATTQAQEDLTRVTEEYEAKLSPLQDQMDALSKRKRAIQDEKRLAQLRETLADKSADANDKALAQIEMEEIALRQQQEAIEEERDSAIDAAEEKVDAAQAAEDAAQKQVDLAQEAVDAAKKQVSVYEKLLGIQSGANSMLREQEGIMESLASAAAGIGAALSGIGASEGIESLLPGTEDLESLSDTLIGELDTIFGGLDEEVGTTADIWGGLFDENAIGDVLGGTMDIVGQRMADSMLTGFQTAMGTRYDTWVDTVNQNVLGPMAAPLEDARENGKGLINALIDAGVMSEAWERLTTWCGEIATHIETWAGEIATTVTTWLTERTTELTTWFSERLTQFTTWLGEVWTTFSTKLTELWTLISTKFQEIKTEIETRWGEAQTFLEDIDLLQVGKDILDGFWDGLKDKWSGIKTWLEDKAASVESLWRRITRTGSPSKVMYEVGADDMAGLGLGMEDQFKQVVTSMQRMANELISTAGGGMMMPALAMPGVSVAGSGLLMDPTVPASAGAAHGPQSIHLVLDIPGFGQAVGEVTAKTKLGESFAGHLTLHGSSKRV